MKSGGLVPLQPHIDFSTRCSKANIYIRTSYNNKGWASGSFQQPNQPVMAWFVRHWVSNSIHAGPWIEQALSRLWSLWKKLKLLHATRLELCLQYVQKTMKPLNHGQFFLFIMITLTFTQNIKWAGGIGRFITKRFGSRYLIGTNPS